MLTVAPKKRIVSRIIRGKDGKIAVAYFLVVEWQGQVYAKLIRVEEVSEVASLPVSGKSQVLALCGHSAEQVCGSLEIKLSSRSPYFSELESFFTSQMTRAPSRS
jgi:hypothetical protein